MSDPGASPPLSFRAFYEWLLGLLEDRSAHELLRVILGEPRGGDLLDALDRARRIAGAMTSAERDDPRGIAQGRRARIAALAEVDVADVSELIMRFTAAAALVADNEDVRQMFSRRAPAQPRDLLATLLDCRDRDLRLWDFLDDQDGYAACP